MRKFRFNILTIPVSADGCAESQRNFYILLEITQDQFEDYQTLKACVHAAIESAGWQQKQICAWHEAPEYTDDVVKKLRAAIGCADHVEFIPYYPHSFNHRSYKVYEVGGQRFVANSFSSGRFIKFAQSLNKITADISTH